MLSLCRAALVFTLFFSVSSQAQYVDQIDIPYTRYTLDNGLTLLVHEDHKAPIATVNIWYHVGSKNERPGITGFAHLFEHLMFNGSENYDGEWFFPLQLAGGTDLNGTTWFDRTNYFQNVPVPALDMVLWMESDRMGHLLGAITQEKLDEQRGVVQNEKRQGDNQPYGRAGYYQLEGMFPEGHPYRWDTIGSMDDLNAASLDDVKEWFETYYGAANAVLVVAGDVNPDEVFEKVKTYFGNIDSGPTLTYPGTWIAKRTESTRDVMYDEVSQSRLTKAWNTPEFGSEESIYLEIAADVLAGGKNSRLYKRLVYDDQIASSVHAAQVSFEIAGMFEIEAMVKPGVELAQVEAAINEELQRFLDDGPTRDELERVKTSYFAGVIRGLEKIGGFSGKAQLLATYETYLGDASAYQQSLRWYEEATARQVRDAAQAWLSSGDYNIEVHPQPDYRVTGIEADRSELPSPGPVPELEFPEVETFSLSNGIPVLLVQRGSLPVVNMSILFDAGYASDAYTKLGIAGMTSAMLDEGTSRRDALQLAEDLELLGARVGAGSSLDMTSVSLNALTLNLEDAIEIYAEVVRSPAFPVEELERVRSNWLDRISQEKSDPQQIALRNLPPLLYGEGHPYAIPFTGSGTEESVTAITQADLMSFHAHWLRPDNATLVVVGPLDRETVTELLEDAFGDWQPSVDTPVVEKRIEAATNTLQPTIYLLDKPGAPQSMIMGGQLLPASSWGDSDVLDMATRIVGGTFNARLNMNLREDKHWAYGVRASAPDAQGQRPYIYYAPVQADKTLESLQEILREVREYTSTNPATAEELERNRAGILRSLPGRYETNAAVMSTLNQIIRFQRPLNYVEEAQHKLENLELERIWEVANEQISLDQSIWLIVGDLETIEQPLRDAGIAEVKILEP